MTPDGTQLLDADVTKMNTSDAYPESGTLFSPFKSTEGNKIYKRGGYYYLLHIEFLNDGHGQGTYILRSRHLYGTKPNGTPGGPGDVGAYDLYKFGTVGPGNSGQDIPGQGGLVDTPDGRWFWIAQFNNYGSDGRKPHLLPITWIDDWPVPGGDIVGNHGQMVWQMAKPIIGERPSLPLGSDDFKKPTLDPKWQWNHQPRADMWSLTERPGYLRLHAFRPLIAGQFFSAGNTLCQRFMRSDHTTEIVKLEIGGMTDGQEAGLAHSNGGKNYATMGVVQTGGVKALHYTENTPGAPPVANFPLPSGLNTIWLRSDVGFDNVNAYSYSIDGKTFLPFGGSYTLRTGAYRGDFVGIYTFNNISDTGYIDVGDFRYTAENR
jgi:beta-xylosidase